MEVRSIFSEKGVKLLVLNNFKFSKAHIAKCGKIRWRCTNTKSRCNAKIYTSANEKTILETQLDHNHEGEKTIARQAISNSVKRKAVEDSTERPSKLIHKELTNNDWASEIGSDDLLRVRRNMYEARRDVLPALPKDRYQFKELQELKKKKDVSKHASEICELPSSNQSPNISLTSSTHSSLNNEPHGENLVDGHNVAQIPSYFDTATYENNYQQPAMFFDKFSQMGMNENVKNSCNGSSNMFSYFNQPSNQTVMDNIVSNIVDTPKVEQGNYEANCNENYSLFSVNNQHSYVQETQNIIHPNHDALSLDDPELKQNELYNLHHQENKCFATIQNEVQSNEDDLSIDDPKIKQESYDIYRNNVPDLLPSDTKQDLTDNIQEVVEDVNGAKSSIKIKEEAVENSTIFQTENVHSKLENTPLQMAHVIDPEFTSASPITDLEKRNLELMSLLEQEKIKCEQQKVLINNLESTISQIGHDDNIDNNNQKMSNEICRLNEELQCHVQTVTMLVGEKSELSVTVNQLEVLLKQKNAECEESQARLKASRSRVAELERELNNFKSEKQKYENAGQEYSELLTQTKQSYTILKDEKEELVQDLLETREKLRTISDEHTKLKQFNHDLSSKLSLANIKIQQISNGDQGEIQVEKLTQEKYELEKQLSNLNSTLNTISKEHNDSNVQYQQYTQQLSAQLTSLSNRIEQLQQDNENLSIQEQSRIKHIGELERQLQILQTEQVAYAPNQFGIDTSLKDELEGIKVLLVQLQMEKTISDENYTKACNERDMLTRELQAKSESLSELESEVERLRGNQPDSAKLLATMESDKVAAAAAVKQNIELKEQVKGMREVIAKMDNDKVDLTEKLSLELSSNKDLLEKLKITELHLQRLTDAIEIKDRELSHLRDASEEVTRQMLQQEHLTDRLRHYEAQDNSSHVLQNELQETKQKLVKLTNELNALKNEKSQNLQPNPEENLETAVKILDNKEIETNSPETINFASLNTNPNTINTSNVTYDDKDNMLDKEEAMRHLEEKFKRTMQDIADLTEEKQRLEHLVLQLQGETETIGEYVALYQQQRMILKQRALENDQQLKQLADDREQMKEKLEKLNELIRKLVIEKGSIPKELLQQHENLTEHSDNFCEAHTKMHEEINKLNDKTRVEMDVTKNTETAEEIIALLSEIKSSNLVEPNENFHHCPWCSGQLITV